MDRTNQFENKDISENKGISAFAYFGLLFILPYFAASDSPFARFHANQGIVLFINQLIMCVFILISHILSSVLPSIFPIVRTLLLFVLYGFSIFYIIYGVVNTLKGKAKELPFIGQMRVLR